MDSRPIDALFRFLVGISAGLGILALAISVGAAFAAADQRAVAATAEADIVATYMINGYRITEFRLKASGGGVCILGEAGSVRSVSVTCR